MSPPKNPIVFYIEHSTPVRYRRWIRQGILYWNQAYEKVGISNAIEVYYQDTRSGAHMEKDVNLIIDVEPKEAGLLIWLIETLLTEWYINRHERKERMANLVKLAKEKKNQKSQ